MHTLQVNLTQLQKLEISPDQYVFLYCEVNKLTQDVRPPIIINHDFFISLQNAGFIKMNDNDSFALRGPAFELFPEESIELDEFIQTYRLIFADSGRTGIMGSKKDCTIKMKKFIEDNPEYSQNRILEAARTYVNSCAESNYKYLQQADYFISKQDKYGQPSSRLLAYLEEQEFKGSTNLFTRHV